MPSCVIVMMNPALKMSSSISSECEAMSPSVLFQQDGCRLSALPQLDGAPAGIFAVLAQERLMLSLREAFHYVLAVRAA